MASKVLKLMVLKLMVLKSQGRRSKVEGVIGVIVVVGVVSVDPRLVFRLPSSVLGPPSSVLRPPSCVLRQNSRFQILRFQIISVDVLWAFRKPRAGALGSLTECPLDIRSCGVRELTLKTSKPQNLTSK